MRTCADCGEVLSDLATSRPSLAALCGHRPWSPPRGSRLRGDALHRDCCHGIALRRPHAPMEFAAFCHVVALLRSDLEHPRPGPTVLSRPRRSTTFTGPASLRSIVTGISFLI